MFVKIYFTIKAYNLKAPWLTQSYLWGLHHRSICLGYDTSKLIAKLYWFVSVLCFLFAMVRCDSGKLCLFVIVILLLLDFNCLLNVLINVC